MCAGVSKNDLGVLGDFSKALLLVLAQPGTAFALLPIGRDQLEWLALKMVQCISSLASQLSLENRQLTRNVAMIFSQVDNL